MSPDFHLRVVCHSYELHPHEWSFRGHLYKHITQRILLTISSEIELSECFVKKVTIFYYIVSNCTNWTRDLSITVGAGGIPFNNNIISDIKYVPWTV